MGEARRTLVPANLASIMERVDEALLPAMYREVGEALHATPTGLGALTLCRSFVQAPCYPLVAYAAVCCDRARVVALGAVPWAAATFLVGRRRLRRLRPGWAIPPASGHLIQAMSKCWIHLTWLLGTHLCLFWKLFFGGEKVNHQKVPMMP